MGEKFSSWTYNYWMNQVKINPVFHQRIEWSTGLFYYIILCALGYNRSLVPFTCRKSRVVLRIRPWHDKDPSLLLQRPMVPSPATMTSPYKRISLSWTYATNKQIKNNRYMHTVGIFSIIMTFFVKIKEINVRIRSVKYMYIDIPKTNALWYNYLLHHTTFSQLFDYLLCHKQRHNKIVNSDTDFNPQTTDCIVLN